MVHSADQDAGETPAIDPVHICGHPRCVAAWETIIHDCDVPTCIGGADGKYLFANRAFCEAIHAPPERIFGSSLRDWFSPEFADERRALREHVITTRRKVKAADMIRGKRYVATMRPLEGGPWSHCVLSILSARGPRPEEVATLFPLQVVDLGPLASLTAREMEILKFIGEGLSQREIAGQLDRTIKTVEAHRAALGRKLRVKKNIQLVQIALEAGLLDTTEPSAPAAAPIMTRNLTGSR